MAIVPRRKVSKARRDKRRSHHALSVPNLINHKGQVTTHRLNKFTELQSKKNKK